jgi:hypothetical protein
MALDGISFLRRISPEIEDYAVTGDGQRFLVKPPVEGEAQAGYTIILSWPALLGDSR